MSFFYYKLIVFSFLIIFSFSNILFAGNNFNLIADKIIISEENNEIIAQGNVKIYSDKKILNAKKIIYNNSSELVKVFGPIEIIDEENLTIMADYSLVSKDLNRIISEGVKALFKNYFKITSEKIKYNSSGKTEFQNSMGTSCKICSINGSPPLWNIKSSIVLHDKENKTLTFENAVLEIGGVPVFYTPYIKTPEPGVKRASGFLTPKIISSDIYGYGFKQPYFLILNENSDITVSLFKTNQTTMLEAEYRAKMKGENINVETTIEPKINDNIVNGFINVKGEKRYPNNFFLQYDFTIFDKKKSLLTYDHEIKDFVVNYLTIENYKQNKKRIFETFFYQSLRTPAGEEPIIFPYYQEKNIGDIFNSKTIFVNSFGILNLFNKNKKYTRIGHSLDFRYNTVYKKGFLFQNLGKISSAIYDIREEDNKKTNYLEIKPLISSSISYPLFKESNKITTEFLIPKLQLNYSPNKLSSSKTNKDSIEIDLDTTSLFATNRYSGKDLQEKGLWLNSGIEYENRSLNGKKFGYEIGQIFRVDKINQFSSNSGLNGNNSDLLISSFFNFKDFFSLKNTSLLTNNFNFRKSETNMSYRGKKNEIESILIYNTDIINQFEKKKLTELYISFASQMDINWTSFFDLRHDITNNKAISALAGLTFENECVDFSVNLSKRFANSEKLPEDTRLELSFDLGGFGKSSRFSNSCGMM